MKILHINTNDKGGAATACIRIHMGLLEQGIDSKILFLNKTKTNIPETYAFSNPAGLMQKFGNKLKRGLAKLHIDPKEKFPQIEWFSSPKSPYDITTHPLYEEADIIQLNWVSGFLDEPSFFRKNKKPVVWRMPDLYTCGGGYHYEKGFPFSKLQSLLNRQAKIRQRALVGTAVTFVPISNWVQEKANTSSIIGHFPKQMIHNGLDFKKFNPKDPTDALTKYSLPIDKQIVLMGADIAHVSRKGLKLAVAALASLDPAKVQPVLFGRHQENLPAHFIQVGYIQKEEDLAGLYAASTLFLMSSVEEAFGQVTIEALACGTPVVSFPNGGSLDIIKEGLNGCLASDFTQEALAAALKKGLDTQFDKEALLNDLRERFNLKDKIDKYIAIYQKLYKKSDA